MKSSRIFAFLAAGAVFCISADAGAASNSVGINTHLAANDVYDAVSAAGIDWVRIDVNWEGVEPSQVRHNWGEIDRVVNKARFLGLTVFATFAYTSCWVSSGNGDGAACRHWRLLLLQNISGLRQGNSWPSEKTSPAFYKIPKPSQFKNPGAPMKGRRKHRAFF